MWLVQFILQLLLFTARAFKIQSSKKVSLYSIFIVIQRFGHIISSELCFLFVASIAIPYGKALVIKGLSYISIVINLIGWKSADLVHVNDPISLTNVHFH